MLLPMGRVPVHPGEMLLEEFLKPAGISQYKLSRDTGMTYRRVNEIVNGRRPVTLDTAFRLARYFEMSAGFWINLQAAWDTWHFRNSEAYEAIERGVEPTTTGIPRSP